MLRNTSSAIAALSNTLSVILSPKRKEIKAYFIPQQKLGFIDIKGLG